VTAFRLAIVAGVLTMAVSAGAQRWQPQPSGTQSDLRGISAVNNKVAWASGTGGAWLRTTNGGQIWTTGVVAGAEELDFRDVEAFDDKNAVLMAAGPGIKSRIYRTRDGGASWRMTFQNPEASGFWDCMAFWDRQHGVMLGDPVDSRFQVFTTDDGGEHWSGYAAEALPGEAAFAASGSCIAVRGDYRQIQRPGEWFLQAAAWFATGGAAARVFRSEDAGASWTASSVPFIHGTSAGIFSIAFHDQHGIAVGGDYQRPALAQNNAAVTKDGGVTWKPIRGAAPRGYRSAVAFVPGRDLAVAVGTSGSDVSRDNGNNWEAIDQESYNAVSFARDGAGWAVGPKGRIARWERVEKSSRPAPEEPPQ